jgi:cytosine/adenosine deaminase-related metal-dependent hydrolase
VRALGPGVLLPGLVNAHTHLELSQLAGQLPFGALHVAALLAFEHTLVRPDDLSRVMQAFNLNGWVSRGYLAFTAAAAWLG